MEIKQEASKHPFKTNTAKNIIIHIFFDGFFDGEENSIILISEVRSQIKVNWVKIFSSHIIYSYIKLNIDCLISLLPMNCKVLR